MILQALDTVHVSSVKSDALRPGEEFELNDADSTSLIERGLAKKIDDSKDGEKMDPPVQNKAEPKPINKAEPARKAAPARKTA